MNSVPGSGPSTKTGAIRKQLIRNVEKRNFPKPIVQNHSKPSVGTEPPSCSSMTKSTVAQTKKGKNCDTKYRVPELNSTICVAKLVKNLKLSDERKHLKSLGDLTPKSKAFVAGKVTCKLNFRNDRPVYKNLTPINVNDSVLELDIRKRTIYRGPFKQSDPDPVPVLTDYLDPIKPWTFEIDTQMPQRKSSKNQQPTEMWNDVWDYYKELNS